VADVYRTLYDAWGHAGWWPGEGPLEVCVGAVLVQNTAWSNAERALAALRSSGLLAFEALRAVPEARLADVIRPSGCYNVKARRLKALVAFLDREYGGRLGDMAREAPAALRAKLLAVPGIGKETADAITLYAAGLPVFVIDAYTRRAFTRLGLLRGDEDYDAIASVFTRALPRDAALFNDYHAQVVRLGKECCRTRPSCASCPLDAACPKVGVD
jgi:endonuclease-3 related protein